MNPSFRHLLPASALLAALATLPSTLAQSTDDDRQSFDLSPFEVKADQDRGYVATATLAGSRLNTALSDTPASISVMTKEFLNDIAATSIGDAVSYGLNTGNDIGGGNANVGASTGNGLVDNEFNIQIRGYRRAVATRDYFPTLLASDMFNVERVEVARGPNSLIFGVGGPGGIVNTSFKSALLDQSLNEISLRVGSWGLVRGSVDLNRPLVEGTLAARVNLLHQDADGWKDFARDDQTRGAIALVYQPADSTRIRFNLETGTMDQNRVRPWDAVDQVSEWEAQGEFFVDFGTPEAPWTANDTRYSQTRQSNGGPSNGLTPNIPPGLTGERRTAHIQQQSLYMTDGPLAGKYLWVGTRPDGARYYRSSYNNGVTGFNTPTFMDDESRFPRRGNPVGPGAVQSTDYDTFQLSLDQRIGQNLNLNLTAQTTGIDRRSNSVMGFNQIVYQIDVTSNLPTFTPDGNYNATVGGPTTTGQGFGALNFAQMVPNPHVGSNIVAYAPNYSLIEQSQDDARLSANYRWATDNFGEHNFLAFAQTSRTGRESERFRETNVAPNRPVTTTWFNDLNYTGRVAHVDFFADDLAQRGVPDPFKNSIPDSVMHGRPQFSFSSGWIRDTLAKSRTEIDSQAFAVQSYLFERSLVATAGVRRDKVEIRNWGNQRDSLGEAIGLVDPTAPQTEKGDTYSVGAVYHIPQVKWLSLFANKSTNFQPQGGAQRFEDADLRPNLEIGALKGAGQDFGVKLRLAQDRLFVNLARYEVSQSNASTSFDGNVTNYINAIWTTIQNDGPNTVQTDQANPNGHRVGGNETRDQDSKGWELELTANPTDSWRLTFNASRSSNATAGLATNIQAYIDKHASTWEQWRSTPYDTGRSPGFLGSNTVGDLIDGLDRIVAVIKAGEGLTEVNIRPWNANLFTAYSFKDGSLGGLTLGGGLNYRGDQILGIAPASLANPQARVFKGGDYFLANAMLAYSFQLGQSADVRLQLNVENLLQNDDMQVLASQYNPATDSIIPFNHYLDPRSYSLSATFSF